MDEKEKTCPVSSVGPFNECLTQFEEPEFSDTGLIACMEVVGKKRGRGESCSFCNTKQRQVDGNCCATFFEMSICHFLTNRKPPFFLLANKRAR